MKTVTTTYWRKGQVFAALSKLYDGHHPQRIAQSLARQLHLSTGIQGPPYSPYDFAKSLGIKIEYREVDAEGVFAHGSVGKPRIFIPVPHRDEPSWTERRRNFTIAHELGHYIIRRTLSGYVAWSVFSDDDPEEEVLCDAFAAELLMPAFVIAKDLRDSASDPDSILELMDRYDVSLKSLLRRAVDLGRSFFAAILWRTGGKRHVVEWAAPSRFRNAVLCDTGKTSVERAFLSREKSRATDYLLLSGRQTHWLSTSIPLPGKDKVLTTMIRTSHEAGRLFSVPKDPVAGSTKTVVPIQRMLPFEEPPVVLAARRRVTHSSPG
ncbi:MAG: ImmA/IrrE family metallo-endopeptidase [Terriglobales bacterium]